MRSLKIDTIKVIRLTMTLGLALFISPVYAGVTDSSAAFAEKLAGNVGTDSVGSYAHPALGGSAVPNITNSGHPKAGAHVAPGSEIKREGSAGKKHSAPVMKKEGSGDKKRHAMKGGHGYSKKSEGSAGKKAYKNTPSTQVYIRQKTPRQILWQTLWQARRKQGKRVWLQPGP